MFGIETPSTFQAATTVGTVLGEAVVLYAGYGVVLQVVSSDVLETLRGE